MEKKNYPKLLYLLLVESNTNNNMLYDSKFTFRREYYYIL